MEVPGTVEIVSLSIVIVMDGNAVVSLKNDGERTVSDRVSVGTSFQ